MHINFVYDPSVADAPAGFKAALNYAANELDALITDPISVNIEIGYGEVGGASLGGNLAEGGALSGAYLTYAQLVAQLTKAASNPAARQELANLPTTAPAAITSYFVSSAQEKAWGMIPRTSPGLDGMVGFSNLVSYATDPMHRAVMGKYDLIGMAEHEITHAMGRAPYNGALELTNFSAPGVFAAPNTGGYFSTDGGRTDLVDFSPISDTSDLNNNGHDAFNAFSYPGVANPMSAVDKQMMGTLGFHLPPPPTITVSTNTTVRTNDQSYNLVGRGTTLAFLGSSKDSVATLGYNEHVAATNTSRLRIDDSGHGLGLILLGQVNAMTVLDWGHDTSGTINLQMAGVTDAHDVWLNHIKSDGAGGSILSGFTGGGSVHFVGATPLESQLHVAVLTA